jgi:hypothetical protein
VNDEWGELDDRARAAYDEMLRPDLALRRESRRHPRRKDTFLRDARLDAPAWERAIKQAADHIVEEFTRILAET